MFSGLMMNTWIAASIVAVIAGVTGFFAVLRGQSFAAHAIPNGAFAGAAGAGLLGLNVIWGLAVFALAGALGIGALGSETRGRRARQDVVTALILVLMLGIGALFLSLSTQYAETTYSLLFGEVFGVSSDVLLPIAALGAVAIATIAVIYRPLLLASALPEVAEARGVSTRRMELCFLVVMALATSMTVPVVGALLMFALMIGPAAAARSFTRRPGYAIAVATTIALVTVWAGIVLSYRTNWPLGFYVGVIAAGFFLLGQGWAAVRRRGSAARPVPALSTVHRSERGRGSPSGQPAPPNGWRAARCGHHPFGGEILTFLAVDELGALVEELSPGRGERREGAGRGRAEHGGPVAVLERQPDAVVPLDRGAHRVAGHQPQQLAARRLIGWRHLVVGEVAAAGFQVRDEAGDQVPGVRQRGADAVQERGVVHLAALRLVQQVRGYR